MFSSKFSNQDNITSTERGIFDAKDGDNYIDSQKLLPLPQIYLLQAVIESFVDGILIITTGGELLHANVRAKCVYSYHLKEKEMRYQSKFGRFVSL
jgi:hypothetical protein